MGSLRKKALHQLKACERSAPKDGLDGIDLMAFYEKLRSSKPYQNHDMIEKHKNMDFINKNLLYDLVFRHK